MTQATQPAKRQYVTPRVNIYETEEIVNIEAELPGVSKDGVDSEVKDNELVLTGRRTQNGAAGELRFQERPRADYYRAFLLGKAVEPDKIEASMQDGVLKITLHKAEQAKVHKIKIQD